MIECSDAAAQPRDRLGQLGAFAPQTSDMGFRLDGLALRHQIDRANAVALADHPVEPGCHLGGVRWRFARGETGELGQRCGHDVDPLADLAIEFRQGLVRTVAQYF